VSPLCTLQIVIASLSKPQALAASAALVNIRASRPQHVLVAPCHLPLRSSKYYRQAYRRIPSAHTTPARTAFPGATVNMDGRPCARGPSRLLHCPPALHRRPCKPLERQHPISCMGPSAHSLWSVPRCERCEGTELYCPHVPNSSVHLFLAHRCTGSSHNQGPI
jgi:hypothetical protein